MLNSRGLIVDLKLMIYFQASLQRVEERTRQFPNGAKYGVTKFSGKYIVPTRPTLAQILILRAKPDLTPEEFRGLYLMKNKIATTPSPIKANKAELFAAEPKQLDW